MSDNFLNHAANGNTRNIHSVDLCVLDVIHDGKVRSRRMSNRPLNERYFHFEFTVIAAHSL